ncbi:sodium:proton antiporter [Bacillaceae bacterium IKA-2]|nr:sodium:proton antiporter [Bacillaceae bacterium IKA-2]
MFSNNNQNNLLVTMLISLVSVFFIYQYRYRVMNRILGTYWFRRLAVAGVMQIPYIRDRIFGRFMTF